MVYLVIGKKGGAPRNQSAGSGPCLFLIADCSIDVCEHMHGETFLLAPTILFTPILWHELA